MTLMGDEPFERSQQRRALEALTKVIDMEQSVRLANTRMDHLSLRLESADAKAALLGEAQARHDQLVSVGTRIAVALERIAERMGKR